MLFLPILFTNDGGGAVALVLLLLLLLTAVAGLCSLRCPTCTGSGGAVAGCVMSQTRHCDVTDSCWLLAVLRTGATVLTGS